MRIDFSVPAEFEEVPLGMDFDAACAEVNARCAYGSSRAGTDEQPLTEMARALQRISRFLGDSGVVYAANCLHSFEGEVSLGSLAVSVVAAAKPPVHRGRSARRGHRDHPVREVRERCGAVGRRVEAMGATQKQQRLSKGQRGVE
ncbi:hypothetical protein [Streptomyces sp. NPDC127038]|uniref:hypothetical protein n=1 Tax=Streptomyces sp. NPDC127038 TaxID=3347114 RepID=UPI00366562F1